jgi:signal transduction histidine kinase
MWKNFVTSGMAIDPSDADYRKLYLTNTLLLTATIIFGLFALVTFFVSKQYVIAAVDLAGAFFAGCTILYLRRRHRLFQSSAILVGLVFVLTLLSIYFDTYPNMNLAWIYVIPLTAFFLLGRKVGLWVVVCYALLYGLILWYKFDNVEIVNKGPVLLANVFGVLAVVTVLTRYFEVSRKEAHVYLERALMREAAQSQVLQDALAELTAYRKQLEEQVEAGLKEISLKDKMLLQQAKMASMGEMVAIIAHQLKQPLNMIALVTQDAKDAYRFGDLDGAKIDTLSDKTLKSVRFMSETIDGFRHFLDPHKKKQVFSLKESIGKAMEIVGPGLKQDDVHVDIQGDDALLFGVPSEMQQVLINLLVNARDAIMEHKAQNRGIEVVLNDKGKNIRMAVQDHAGGVPEELMDTLFGSFVTSKGKQGTGMGLYMVKMIVESLGGKVTARNIGDGACFTIELPKTVSGGRA